jgi:hypothetical protein
VREHLVNSSSEPCKTYPHDAATDFVPLVPNGESIPMASSFDGEAGVVEK